MSEPVDVEKLVNALMNLIRWKAAKEASSAIQEMLINGGTAVVDTHKVLEWTPEEAAEYAKHIEEENQ